MACDSFGWSEATDEPDGVRQSAATTAREDQSSPGSFGMSKAPEGWRSPRRFANTSGRGQARQRFGVRRPSAAFSIKPVKKQVFIVYQLNILD